MRLLSLIATFFIFVQLHAQTGGTNVFPFLDLGYNARSVALGRNYIAMKDADLNLAVHNPALLNSKMNHTVSFNQALLAAGINHGMVAYARDVKDYGTASLHLRYVAYGEMERTNVNGEVIGTFSAGDFVLGAGFGQELNPLISIGGNVNLIWSQLEAFSALGVSIDLGGVYQSEDQRTTAAALIRNAGYQLTTYTTEDRAPLPVNAMLSFTHKLEHAPFLLGIVAQQLNRWDLTYVDPNAQPTTDPITGESIPIPTAGFAEKLARHFAYQIEMFLGETMRIRGAFDYQRRREFLVPNRPGMAGFSFGVGLNFKRFNLDYGLMIFSNAGYNNMISITTDINKWRK